MDAGAGALYIGYQPPAWVRGHLPLESFNRRTFAEASLASLEEVASLCAQAGTRGVPVWAAFNAAYYPAAMYEPVLSAARDLQAAGVTGFIVSDLGLIGSLGEEGIGGLALSAMAGVMNARAARFFGNLGLRRITLPRDLTVGEIAAIAAANPELTFDVFVLFGACANLEPFCRWAHEDPRRIWPCVQEWRPVEVAAGTPLEKAANAQASWSGVSRVWACGLCALAELARIPNVEGLKLVGRGAPTERKLAGVRILRRLLDLLAGGARDEEYRAAARAAKLDQTKTGCLPRLCYFPEYLPIRPH